MAGPPVEVQVRVNTGGSVAGSVSNWKVISPGIVTWPVGEKDPSHKWRGPSSHSISFATTHYKDIFLKLPHL